MNESRSTMTDSYDLDHLSAVPQVLRLRTIHVLALLLGVVSIAAAIEWPRAWQLVALADLAAMSLLFALAAGREWFVRYRPVRGLALARFVGTGGHRFEYQTVVS